MTVGRIYRRGNPPVPRTWTKLDARNARGIIGELMSEVDSILAFCGVGAFDWTTVTAPPDDSPMLTTNNVVDGWPSARYFARALYQICTTLRGAFNAITVGGFVWESPDSWLSADEAYRWTEPDYFFSLFDVNVSDGFGESFTLMEKWKGTIEAVRSVCDSLLVMFLSIAAVVPLNDIHKTQVKQIPQRTSEPIRYTRYVPLPFRMCVYGSTQYWRSFTPEIYDNSVTSQYFCVDGPPRPNPGWLNESTRTQTPNGAHTVCNVRVGSIGETINASFGVLAYDSGITSSESSLSGGVLMICGEAPRGVLALPKINKRIVDHYAIEPGYEVGQAAPYNVVAGLPESGRLRQRFGSLTMYAITVDEVDALMASAQSQCTRILGYHATERYKLIYPYDPNEYRDFVVGVDYPCVFSRDYTDSEKLALTASVTVTINGSPFVVSVAPNETQTISESVYVPTSEIYITASASNAASIINATADMWKVDIQRLSYTQETRWFTYTGETVRVGDPVYGELAAVVDWTATTYGNTRDPVRDEPLVKGGIRIRIERT